jgi:predicted kinase
MSKLLVIRGNSGSGKSTIAEYIHSVNEDSCLVAQDYYIKYSSLDKEQDEMRKQRIFNDVKHALSRYELVILEGVFDSRRYKEYFDDLITYHSQDNFVAYLDVSFEETLSRHQLRPKKDSFGEKEMNGWYAPHDYLGYESEFVINESKKFDESIALINLNAGL